MTIAVPLNYPICYSRFERTSVLFKALAWETIINNRKSFIQRNVWKYYEHVLISNVNNNVVFDIWSGIDECFFAEEYILHFA